MLKNIYKNMAYEENCGITSGCRSVICFVVLLSHWRTTIYSCYSILVFHSFKNKTWNKYLFTEVHFNKTYPSDWFDPKNWCSSITETGNCTDMILESEMVPCSYDNVVFPKDSSFFVNVEAEMEIVVNTLKISGKVTATNISS